jgi:hypothetical protein
VAADAVWLYGHVTGAVAAHALKRLAQLDLSETSLWRRVETWGTHIQAYETSQQATANALPLRGDAPPSALRLPYKMGVETPCECIYPLGTYRPGDCAPRICEGVPLSIRGALFETGAVLGAVYIIP